MIQTFSTDSAMSYALPILNVYKHNLRPSMIKIHADILSPTVSQGCLAVPLGLDSGITVVVETAIEPGCS